MARKLAGEADERELEELREFLETHPEWQLSYEMVQAYWKEHPDTPPAEWEVDLAIDRITSGKEEAHADDDPRRRRRRRRRAMMIGGVGALFISGICLWVLRAPVGAPKKLRQVAQANKVETRLGTRSRLVLPDGTTVWLNVGSVLTYPSSFYSPNREVTLDGEAFFDVVKDPLHPFIVHASALNIRVLGTTFDVRAYSLDKTVEATLIKGAVEVTRKDAPNAPRILLRPNEKLVFHTEPATKEAETASASPAASDVVVTALKPYQNPEDLVETAWIRNRLEFRGDSFEDLAAKMERWYNVRISFAAEEMKQDQQFRFTGSFEKETITQALDELKLTARFNYTINNNEIKILP